MNLSCIRLENIRKSFKQGNKKLIILDSITAKFKKGKSYAITGSSGIGKSTFLHIIAGLDMPTQGSVYFNNSSIFEISQKEKEYYTNHCLGFVFQQAYLINELSVLENVLLKGLIGGNSYRFVENKALFLLDKVGLLQKAQNMPYELSGGQQQRVALARALMNQPDFLFADEPTGNLDDITSSEIIDILINYQKKYSMGLIISTHNTMLAEQLDYIYEVKNGKILKKPLDLNEKNHIFSFNVNSS